MGKIDPENYDIQTCAVRGGQVRTPENENSDPVFLTSSFVFNDAAEAAARFSGEQPGNIYSRFTNPTVRTFEERLAAMEGGERCIGTASGMSAIMTTCMGLLSAGDHIVSSRSVFGTTVGLFGKLFPRFGLETTFVPQADLDAWKAAIRPETRLLILETPSNPLMEICDIRMLADIAHDNDCLLVVDNCFCTPILQRPLEFGADIVIHSATKFLDGQGRCVGGAIVGPEDKMSGEIFGFLRTAGPTMSPFNAWVFLKGLETLGIRMEAHCRNAGQVADWLSQQQGIRQVFYPGLVSHPQHELAQKQQSAAGAIVSFEVVGGREAAWRLIDSTRLLSITANLGDVKTSITHPASTTHNRLTPEQRQEAGISEGLIRVSVGHEAVTDIIKDLEQALDKAR